MLCRVRPVEETPTKRAGTVQFEKTLRGAVPTVPACPGHRWPGTWCRSAQPRPPVTCPRHHPARGRETRCGALPQKTHSAPWGEAADGGRAPIARPRQLTSPAEMGGSMSQYVLPRHRRVRRLLCSGALALGTAVGAVALAEPAAAATHDWTGVAQC